MVHENELQMNEVAVTPPEVHDAGLTFIGRILTPWTSRMETPRQGRHDGPLCAIEIYELWVAGSDPVQADRAAAAGRFPDRPGITLSESLTRNQSTATMTSEALMTA